VFAYLIARSGGKMLGAFVGGVCAHARKEVTRYTGMALFTQGGIAMGLALSINHNIN